MHEECTNAMHNYLGERGCRRCVLENLSEYEYNCCYTHLSVFQPTLLASAAAKRVVRDVWFLKTLAWRAVSLSPSPNFEIQFFFWLGLAKVDALNELCKWKFLQLSLSQAQGRLNDWKASYRTGVFGLASWYSLSQIHAANILGLAQWLLA